MTVVVDLTEILFGILNEDTEEEYLEKAIQLDYDEIITLINHGKMDEREKIILSELTLKVLKAVYEYTGKDLITDEKYDSLHEAYKELTGRSIVGVERGGDHVHKYPRLRGSADKIHFIDPVDRTRKDDKRRSYKEFLQTTINRLGYHINDNVKVLLSLKIDGVSAVAECNEQGKSELVLKRGDTDNEKAKEIYSLKGIIFDQYVDTSVNKPFGIKLEVAMTKAKFDLYKIKYGAETPRSAVTSIVNTEELDLDKLEYLSIIPLQYQYEGDEIEKPCYLEEYTRTVGIYDYKGIAQSIVELYMVSARDGIPADGVVIRILDDKIIEELGRHNSINLYETAFKFPAGSEETDLLDVEFSLGILGGITPVAKVKTVKINGTSISSPSLGSMRRFRTLNLRYGQRVRITHDVIPYLEPLNVNVEGDLIPIPTDCPLCKQPLTEIGEELACKNTECPGLIRGKLINFIEKVDIGGISISTVDDFFVEGFLHSLPDLYRLHEHESELSDLKGYGKRSIETILDSIESKRKLKDHIFLGALGIKGVGRKKFRIILDEVSFKDFLELAGTPRLFDVLNSIKGIGVKYIDTINNFFIENREMIDDLLEEVFIESGRSTVNGMTVLFSDVRDKELEKFLEGLGHTVADSYTKKVDVVIVPSKKTQTKKVKDATKDGKLVMVIGDFKKDIGYYK